AKGQPLRLASATGLAPYRVEADGTIAGAGPDGKEVSGSVAFLLGGRHREDALVRLTDGRLQVFPIPFDSTETERLNRCESLPEVRLRLRLSSSSGRGWVGTRTTPATAAMRRAKRSRSPGSRPRGSCCPLRNGSNPVSDAKRVTGRVGRTSTRQA